MATREKKGSVSVMLGNGKELSLHVFQQTLPFEVHSLQCGEPALRRDSTDTSSLAAKEHSEDEKKDILRGLVKVIVYLESLPNIPKHQVEDLWHLYKNIETNKFEQPGVDEAVDDEVGIEEVVATQVECFDDMNQLLDRVEQQQPEHTREYIEAYPGTCATDVCQIDDFTTVAVDVETDEFIPMETHPNKTTGVCNIKAEPNTSVQSLSSPEKGTTPVKYNYNKKKYECEHCGKKFYKKLPFTAHLRSHAGVVPYQCKLCARVYQTLTGYRAHMVSHRNIDFQCELCGKSFQTNGSLYTHMRSHDTVKRYECSLCGKRSSTSSGNLVHMRTHTGDKPYQCNVCGTRFTRKGGLKKHTQQLHPDVLEENRF